MRPKHFSSLALCKLLTATLLACGAILWGVTATATEVPQTGVDENGVVHAPALDIPFSPLASDEAKKAFIETAKGKVAVPAREDTSAGLRDVTQLLGQVQQTHLVLDDALI